MAPNMDIYERVRRVPEEAQRKIESGRLKGFTDINPMWRIQMLTDVFGPCGFGWWYDITRQEIITDELSNQRTAFVNINLYVVNPNNGDVSKPITGTGGASFVKMERAGPYLSDECYKMALTDALSVACKALGIGADVYWSAGSSKYSQDAGRRLGQDQSGADCGRQQDQGEGSSYHVQRETELKNFEIYRCDRCGAALMAYKNGRGGNVSIAQHMAGSLDRFGQVLCLDCIRAVFPAACKQDLMNGPGIEHPLP